MSLFCVYDLLFRKIFVPKNANKWMKGFFIFKQQNRHEYIHLSFNETVKTWNWQKFKLLKWKKCFFISMVGAFYHRLSTSLIVRAFGLICRAILFITNKCECGICHIFFSANIFTIFFSLLFHFFSRVWYLVSMSCK